MWLIQAKTDLQNMTFGIAGLYWSNEDGWVARESATFFTAAEKDSLRLPIDGEWILVE